MAPLAGTRTHHPKFGDGIVVSYSPDGADYVVTIAFKGGSGFKRNFILSMTSPELV